MTDHQGCEETKKICVEIEQNLLKIKTTEIDACRLRIEDYQLREKLYNAYESGRKENIRVTVTSEGFRQVQHPPATDISKEYAAMWNASQNPR
jgi:RNase adaptor protein for sRNA GlmZ degradation